VRIEHVGLQVEDPAAMADWYVTHLGFVVKRSNDEPVCVRFLSDDTEKVMLEVYKNPTVNVPDYSSMDALLLHVAFVCEEVDETAERLVQAGATVESAPETLATGDRLAMLRDPWGLAIQLCRRADPMV